MKKELKSGFRKSGFRKAAQQIARAEGLPKSEVKYMEQALVDAFETTSEAIFLTAVVAKALEWDEAQVRELAPQLGNALLTGMVASKHARLAPQDSPKAVEFVRAHINDDVMYQLDMPLLTVDFWEGQE